MLQCKRLRQSIRDAIIAAIREIDTPPYQHDPREWGGEHRSWTGPHVARIVREECDAAIKYLEEREEETC